MKRSLQIFIVVFLIYANGYSQHVFFHLEELHSVTEGIREALTEDGVFVVQFLYMKRIVDNLAFDQIYHEHLLYYNLNTIEVLLNRHGLSMFDAYLSPIHGGSIIGFVTHKGKKNTRNTFDPTTLTAPSKKSRVSRRTVHRPSMV